MFQPDPHKIAKRRIAEALKFRAKRLDLSDLRLTILPPDIGKLTALTRLLAQNNRLTALSPEIGKLTALTTLDVSHNQLTALPAEIGMLTNLIALYVSNNQLTALPAEIGKLTGLLGLSVHDNQLTALPPEIGKLTALAALDANHNQLTALPPEIGRLTALAGLYVHNNQLAALPLELGELTALTDLSLGGNPLSVEVGEVAGRGIKELQNYLRRLATEAAPLREGKLVLVGIGNVGKTCLLHALQRKQPRHNQGTTYGIEIAREPLGLNAGEDPADAITLNCWDFGGQDVYRVTHQFFFSPSAIYLVLWDPRNGAEKCDVRGWLSQIRLRVGAGARVIVVATHVKTEGRVVRIDTEELEREFADILVGFHEVDSFAESETHPGEPHGVGELRDWITRLAADLEEVNKPFPRSFRQARDEILDIARARGKYEKKSPRAWMPFAEYAEICGRHTLTAGEARTLAVLLNRQGHIVYFDPRSGEMEGEVDGAPLEDVVVLQPEWLAKAIGFVLEDPPTNQASGILQHARLREIWCDRPVEPRYDLALRPFFLRLMERFDVSYRLEGGRESLVPQLIKDTIPNDLRWRPEAKRAEGECQLAQMCAFDAVPTGLIPLLIARTHRYEGDDGRHWNRGMFLDYTPYGSAYLELQGRELVMHVRGGYPAHFMTVLTESLEKLLRDVWPGLLRNDNRGYILKAPCYTPMREGRFCAGRFPLDALRSYQKEGDVHTRCEACTKKLDIAQLLLGFAAPGADIHARLDELLGEMRNLRQFNEAMLARCAEMFRQLLRAMASERHEAPGLFTLIHDKPGVFNNKYRLTLWCEYPEQPHPLCPIGSDGDGEYTFDRPKDWLVKAAPIINWTLRILKVAVPVAGAMVKAGIDESLLKDIGSRIDAMESIVHALPDGELELDDIRASREGLRRRPFGGELRAFHDFLSDVCEDRTWGGLRRCYLEDDFYWLCPFHYRVVEPGMPRVD